MSAEHVILLHGLSQRPFFLGKITRALERAGYATHNTGYASRKAAVRALALDTLPAAIRRCEEAGAERIHFVTHSMGGVLVRAWFEEHVPPAAMGRVVMLAPPNKGSEVAERLRDWRFFKRWFGPAAQELGTGAESAPRRLCPVRVETGILAGTRPAFWDVLLGGVLPRPNDGKVSVESTRLDGMSDHLVLPVSHSLIVRHPEAIRQILHFLRHGNFARTT